ncbi:MAG: hypothetical protein IKQ16_01270 [Lentisphaeria bacterium]|nr:hypothetical protein [Lentisphaeria bacterium]
MKTLQTVSLSLALLVPIFLCSCADFWFDWRNEDNPPPDTPAVDPVEPVSAPTVVLLTNDQLVASATQSLILALTKKGLTGVGMNSPQNSIYADRVMRSLLSEAIVRNGSDYCLVVSGPTDEGFDIVVSKELGGDPVIRISKKRRQ